MSVRLEANVIRKLGRAISNGEGYDFPAPVGNTALGGLTDVVITNPQDGDVLTYDFASGKWINKQPAP